jgi:hypothetical protein
MNNEEVQPMLKKAITKKVREEEQMYVDKN